MAATTSAARSPAYERLQGLLEADRCVILDGGMATELQRQRATSDNTGLDRQLWGTWALYRAPHAVLDVHKSYVADHPLLGTGPGTYHETFKGQYAPKAIGFHAHNMFLHVAAETGIPAMI